MTSSRITGVLFILSCLSSFPLRAGGAQAFQGLPQEVADLPFWRHIGPAAFGGRIDDIEAVPGNPDIIFVGTASGGIFKSVNNGVTWKPVFDQAGTSLSIGDIAIAPSDPNIIWAGTGEANNRQSSSWGQGVFKSLDGGETWRSMGLAETHHIGRVVIDPRNPDVVFVAALGHLWGPNPERGLFRTRDGGKSWEKILFINEDTGVVDVALCNDGRTLFAGAYQRRRRAWGFVGGGPGGGLYRSLDAGDTWEKLSGGLPQGDIGRIGIDISKSRQDTVYAIIEHKNGGVFRSDDRGASWRRTSDVNNRPSYYSQIRVDPVNPDRVWALGSPLFLSVDGGKTFSSEGTQNKIHVDHHALWIDPARPDHMMLGNDGGLYVTYDGSENWDFIDNLPIGQYYDITLDTRDPYWIYGGTQDNGYWGLPSRTYSLLGIMNPDVVNIAYGDGFYGAVDPQDPRVIFAESQSGRAYRVDLDTREEKGIRPVPSRPDEGYRFNWSSPMLLSPHDPQVLYYGGNKLFRTRDRGHSWEEISPDLTRRQDWKKLPIMGMERNENTLSRDDGVSDYGTITTIAESPRQAGLIYVGTDDGTVQITRDGGKTWEDLTGRFPLPGPRWVSRVLCSTSQAGTAFVAFDGHQDDDFKPYIFKTADFGRTWVSLGGTLPDGIVVNALAQHLRNPDLLLAGTEFGLFATLDGGSRWTLMHGSLPRVPIDDILFHEKKNDIVLGTHGRSIILLDDATFLESMTAAIEGAPAHLFAVRPATQFYEKRLLPVPGASEFAGPNPDYGALITYWLGEDPGQSEVRPQGLTTVQTPASTGDSAGGGSSKERKAPLVKIEILDPQGKKVRDLEGPEGKGLHRIAWDLRYALPFETKDEEGWFGPDRGPFVLPGNYVVRLSARGVQQTRNLEVRVDPLAKTDPRALAARHEASQAVVELQRAFVEGAKLVQAMDREMAGIRDLIAARAAVPGKIKEQVDSVAKKLETAKEEFKSGWEGPKFKIFDLAGQLQASFSSPTEAQQLALRQMQASLRDKTLRLNDLLERDFAALKRDLKSAGIEPEIGKPVTPPAAQPRP